MYVASRSFHGCVAAADDEDVVVATTLCSPSSSTYPKTTTTTKTAVQCRKESLPCTYDVMPIKQHMQDSYVALLEIVGTGRLIPDKGTRRRHHVASNNQSNQKERTSCRILTMVARVY
jgi:hypothetical protein